MNFWGRIAVGAILLGMTAPAGAVEAAYKTTSANKPDAIWSKIKGFCDITNALPSLKCKLSADGQTRTLTTPDGGVVVEKLEGRDDAARSYGYMILDPGPLPVANYHSKISVTPDGQGSVISWTSTFDAKGASDADAKKAIEGLYKAGADTLAK